MRALLALTLVLAGCATTSDKIPGFGARGEWQYDGRRVVGAGVDVELVTETFALSRVEHALALQHRRERHFQPLEHRWVLHVLLSGPTLADSNRMAVELGEIVALRPGGERVVVPLRGRTNQRRVKYIAEWSAGEDPAPGPRALLVAGQRIELPAP